MLTSCKLTGNPAAVSAYHTKEENYYFSQAGGVESLGADGGAQSFVRIYGKLAQELGFKVGEAISEEAFTSLLSGKNAAGVPVTRKHKVNGIDLTFSAPKSVSIAGLLTIRDPKIIEAHDRAVLETMAEIERHCAGTRPTALEQVKTENLAYVAVRDGFNRDHDPHLHTHVVVANMTSLGGKVMAVDGRQIMTRDFNKMWGAMYRAKLAAFLKEHGYAVSYTKKGELRMDAVSLEVEREFSGRRAQIAAAKEGGARDMDAWRKTRKQKDAASAKADILASWRERLARHASRTADENREATVRARNAWYREAKWSIEARQELAGERTASEGARWQLAARRATEEAACVTAQAIITEYLAELGRAETWEHVTFAEAERRLLDQVKGGSILATDDGRFTTWELMRADRECLAGWSEAVGLAIEADRANDAVRSYSEKRTAQGLRTLSPRQAAAAAGILSDASRIIVVQGDAGAGKTTMLRAVGDIAAGAGWETVGVTVQGVAARKLQEESGIASTTLASYMSQERATARPAAGMPRLVVVDEASMLHSRGLADLLALAEKRGDKVVLVGDRNQLQSVGAGKPFERLVEAAEVSGKLLSLNENYRQRNPELRRAVDLARQGRMRESVDLLDGLGKLDEIEDTYLRRVAIAKRYDKDTLILTSTREGCDNLNTLIRERLVREGSIDAATERSYSVSWADADGVRRAGYCRLAVGDRVTFLENEYKRYDLRNGEVGTVTGTSKTALAVRLDDGREVALDTSYYSAVGPGYALTTYKSQGQTYDKVVVEADTRFAALQDQRNSYVQITRARDDVKIFTDDRAALRDLAGVLSSKRDTMDLKASLSHATAMEQRVREENLALRAEREVVETVVQAAAAAEKVPALPRLWNGDLVVSLGDNEILRKGLIAQLDEVDERLRSRADLELAEQHAVVDCLSRLESVQIFDEFMSNPDSVIAAALVRSGTRDLDAATRDFQPHQKTAVEEFLGRESSTRAAARDAGRELDLGPEL